MTIDKTVTLDEFWKHRAPILWMTNTRPDLACRCNNLSQVTAQFYPKETVKVFNHRVKVAHKHKNVGRRYKALDHDTIHNRCYTNASFGNNDNLSSQIGVLVLLCDNDETLIFSTIVVRRALEWSGQQWQQNYTLLLEDLTTLI